MNFYKSKKFFFVFLLLLLQGCAFSQEVPDVCITKTGEKYHQCTCRYLKYSSFQVSLTEATQRGYTPCSVCKPPIPQDDSEEPVVTPQQNGGTVKKASPAKAPVSDRRCTATTKAGTRCKRAAASGSTKCWQHQ